MEEKVHTYGEMRTEFWWGNLHKRDHLEDLGIDGRILNETGEMAVAAVI